MDTSGENDETRIIDNEASENYSDWRNMATVVGSKNDDYDAKLGDGGIAPIARSGRYMRMIYAAVIIAMGATAIYAVSYFFDQRTGLDRLVESIVGMVYYAVAYCIAAIVLKILIWKWRRVIAHEDERWRQILSDEKKAIIYLFTPVVVFIAPVMLYISFCVFRYGNAIKTYYPYMIACLLLHCMFSTLILLNKRGTIALSTIIAYLTSLSVSLMCIVPIFDIEVGYIMGGFEERLVLMIMSLELCSYFILRHKYIKNDAFLKACVSFTTALAVILVIYCIISRA